MTRLRFLDIAGKMVVILAVSILTGTTSRAEESIWTWTRGNPKPVWWTWDEKYETAKPVRGGYIRYAVNQYVGVLNPNHWPVNHWSAISKIYEKMIYNDGSYRPGIPWLAASWDFPTPVTCIMKLRRGVQFHDKTDFDAHSYKYQIDWILDKNNGCWDRAWLKPVKSVEVLDKYTLEWTFKEPWAGFPGMMANPPGFVISKKALEGDSLLLEAEKLARKAKQAKKNAAKAMKEAEAASAKGEEASRKAKIKAEEARKKSLELAELSKQASEKAKGIRSTDVNPVTTGRYMLEEARPGNYLKIKRNPNWWFGKSIGKPEMPYLDGQILTVIPDPSVQLANLRADKIDSMVLSPDSYRTLLKDPALVIHTQAGNQHAGLRFNMARGPCRDIRVRKAISHAIDRAALIKGLKFGLATPASCIFPGGHWCKNPDLEPVKYDPELAKKYLAEAGFEKGLKISGYMFSDTTSNSLGIAIQHMLAQVGINWAFKALDLGAATRAMTALDYDLGQGGYPDTFDPDPPVTTLYGPKGGFNNGRSNNLKAIALIEAGRREIDIQKRQQIYFELEKVLYDNYEDVWLWYPKTVWAYSKRVKGYNPELHEQGLEGYWNTHCLWLTDGGAGR